MAIARPLTVPIHPTTAGVNRARNADAATTSTTHHAAEPSSTPPTTTKEGRANEPPVPSPRVAARAANETIVAGLVIVRPSVDRYAQARPRPVGAFAGWADRDRRSSRILAPSSTRTTPPTTASGRRPATNAAVSAATPNVAMKA